MKKLQALTLALSMSLGASQVDARYLQADSLGQADGPSVYGYAHQNPTNNIDPTGQYCVTMNGQTTCRVPGKYEVSFPKSNSWDNNSWFGPGTPGYHFYDKSVLDPNKTYDVDCLLEGLLNTPDVPPSNGASSGGTRNYANPMGGLDNFFANPVDSYSFSDRYGNRGIVNVTRRGHGLSDGIVVRIATPQGIRTYGEGNGRLQRPGSPFADPINNVWPPLNRELMDNCTCELGQ